MRSRQRLTDPPAEVLRLDRGFVLGAGFLDWAGDHVTGTLIPRLPSSFASGLVLADYCREEGGDPSTTVEQSGLLVLSLVVLQTANERQDRKRTACKPVSPSRLSFFP